MTTRNSVACRIFLGSIFDTQASNYAQSRVYTKAYALDIGGVQVSNNTTELEPLVSLAKEQINSTNQKHLELETTKFFADIF